MPYFVSRQAYFYNKCHFVEVASGGLDYAGPDMLAADARYRHFGDCQEYADPRDAVEAAIRIVRAWRHDLRSVVRLTAKGVVGGAFGVEGEPLTVPEIRKWADQEWESLPKCARCGKPLPCKRDRVQLIDDPGIGEFCSEECAQWVADQMAREIGA